MNNESNAPTPGTRGRITMSTIAKELGVTKTTVSLALRNHPSISTKTTQRVKDLAAKLNYRPDPAISAIATQRWSKGSPDRHRVIAFLCNAPDDDNESQMRYFPSARDHASELGYKLEIFNVDEYPSAQSINRVLYARGIRGVVIPPINNPSSQRIAKLEWSKFTSVCAGIGRVRPALHTVTPDTFSHTQLVWKILQQAGYKRIGAALYRHEPIAHDDWLRYGATTSSINFLNLEQSESIPIFTGDFADSQSLLDWYDKHRPEVVLGFNDSVCEQLEEGGVDVPGETQFVSLLSKPGSKYSGIIQLFDEIARKSIDLLDSEIRHNHWGMPDHPFVTLVRPQWNRGSTLYTSPESTDERFFTTADQQDGSRSKADSAAVPVS